MPDTPASARPPFLAPLSAPGLLIAALLFGLSITPSMVPRAPEMQGILGGVVAAVGYLLWWGLARSVIWLGQMPPRDLAPSVRRGMLLLGGGVGALCLWKGAEWQQSIHDAWNLPPVQATAPLRVALIALAVFLALLALARVFLMLSASWQRRSRRVLPPRLAHVAGILVALAVFAAVIDGIAVRGLLRGLDNTARLADSLIPPDLDAPASPLVAGGPGSPLRWKDMGRWGRSFVATGPDADAISAFWGKPAMQPIRVYIGLNAADTPEARARLAFDELARLGGFDRSVLVVAMPTGSGWLDPGGMDTLDYITRGDVATVAVQYSYLPSPVSVVVDPRKGVAEAQALFDIVYSHWTTLPAGKRPRLYLHGLSLGAFLSQETVPLLDLYADPIQGALWTGSPYLSEFWRMVQTRRNAGSPAWRPAFGNGSLIRTMNQDGGLDRFQTDWGPMRFVFLQYGSDPIVFFDWSLAWSRPDWLAGDRAPDLSPRMRWLPLVTLLQVGLDMAFAVGTLGYGHDYMARHYIPAWAATLDPPGWTVEDEARLIAHLDGLVPR
ncbi:alpha/beta-hydrolase family protein [Tabrizicola sp. YIM 78059]|uniref:alpha/beta hydrolase n=1 Tax=Tabrizicola sp. YIM 78059 TaxID=2529861 RepID=UPI0020C1878A|nr:alpha/beta-hydrolase family protein [Tabrizicola sp. YIM 78059]